MEVGYLVFVYEPFAKYHEVVKTPMYTRNLDELRQGIKELRLRRNLLYIDIFVAGEESHTVGFDNTITDRELDKLIDDLSLLK